MMGTKRCKVIKAYGYYNVGDEIWPPGVLRDELLACEFIEVVEDDQPQTERAMAGPTETGLRETKPKRKRGRPRKDEVRA